MCKKEEIIVDAKFEDEAWNVAKFVQELSKVQDGYFEQLLLKAKEEELVKGMSDFELRDWVFDYVYNSGDDGSSGPSCSFYEHIPESIYQTNPSI